MLNYKLLCLFVFTALVFSSCLKTAADVKAERAQAARQKAIQSNLANNEDQMSQLRREVGELRGKVEEQDYYRNQGKAETGKVVEDLRKTVIDLDEKVGNIEKVQIALYEEIKAMKEEQIKKISKPKRRSKKKRVITSAYQSGLNLQKGGKHDAAIKQFESFIASNRKSKNWLAAHYHLGESQFATKKYKQAIVSYSTLHEKQPKSNLGRKSTLRIAQCLWRRGQKEEAIAFADLLITSAPKSKEAARAKRMFK